MTFTRPCKKLHSVILQKTRGGQGFYQKGLGYLESALAHIQNDAYCPALSAKCTHLMFSCMKFHPFLDGNKRATLALGACFLMGHGMELGDFEKVFEDIVMGVAVGGIDKDWLETAITQHIHSH
ncbi:Fic family protein [Helicobacter ailurogastricus]|uniref:Fic family protein n=1 Tax=Helicobacter ailurogastricus TaxID=1578720 RepID=UPI0025579E6A|nr:Fic family protein [Helicobacter ailurogastricus]